MKRKCSRQTSNARLALHHLHLTFIGYPIRLARYSLNSALAILSLLLCWLSSLLMTLTSAGLLLLSAAISISLLSYSRRSSTSARGKQSDKPSLTVVPPKAEAADERKAD